MRPRAGVHDDRVGDVAHAMQVLDELALGVRLKEAGVETELAGEAVDRLLELAKCDPAVVLGIAAPDLVEVHAVHDLDAVVAHAANSVMTRPPADARRPNR